jgi:hypothetical protein
MIPFASLIERFGADYLGQYPQCARQQQRQALNAMRRCRTTLAARMLAQCGDCGEQQFVPHSCGHRLCPHCQHHESQAWIERQTRRLVACNYFLITFTLPAELRPLVWQHQRWSYTTLMECAWATLRTFSQNHKQLQGTPGAVAVLHTHSRQLEFHPHAHMVMPAAALDADKGLWRSLRGRQERKNSKDAGNGYLFNHKALAKVFRGKFLAALHEEGLSVPPSLPEEWVVDCKGVGDGQKALVYLGRYLYRGVIQEKDILRCENGQVTYRWRDSKTNKAATRTVSGAQFLRLVLQHVLPKGFRRARCFGFLHPNSKRLIALLKLLVFRRPNASAAAASTPHPTATPRAQWKCSCCGAPMVVVRRRILPRLDAPPKVQSEAAKHP